MESNYRKNGAHARRNVLILAICQALAMSGSSLVMTISALAGHMLATEKTLATVPLAFQFTATMVSTIPASLLMGRIGRRAGFTLGQTIGLIGAGIACHSIYEGNFWMFAAGSAILGIHNAFWQYYRFAAADTAGKNFRARAISYVMAGGVIAAVLGPQISKWTVDMFEPALFAGGYIGIIGLSTLALMLLQLIRFPAPTNTGVVFAGRPVLRIIRQPKFILAVAAAMFGYSVMTLVMTATPLAMTICGFGFDETATVIQWHVLAMFAPSFFTGHLITRYGVTNIIIAGTILNLGAMAINLAGVNLLNFSGGLILLGLGWNFMFIGGTTMVTETYRPEEQSKIQAFNDFLVFGTVAAASFSSGAIHAGLGWAAVNITLSVPMVSVFIGAVWFKFLDRTKVAKA
ncbi:MAG: MFS transporter [Rhodospirillaceae bacterium TMED8]|nr:MFS transporter [Magnetovibrio sp.]OUT51930.1 MAG: MFS transporter [Rhodospirillaceae bacterium TMED8]|tara:strand:+ start:1091 stop:2299 length:1209 start_codon:yes stop_codon:yes gene_type:complete